MKYLVFILSFLLWFWSFAVDIIVDDDKIAPSDPNNVIDNTALPDENSEDVLRRWTRDIMWWTNLRDPGNIQTSEQAQTAMMMYIKNVINYFLALLGFIALVYLLYHWFLMVTAWGNEEKFKKWVQWLKTATIALFWIWLSWLVISLILYIISFITNG